LQEDTGWIECLLGRPYQGNGLQTQLIGEEANHLKNRYAQVFVNKAYFSCIYPMDSKSKACDALRLFCQEFGVPEKLTFDGSKEQTMKGNNS
jgi:hypothetical protein